jgi:predicted ATPase
MRPSEQRTFLRRVGIRSFKSIAKADVSLSPLTVLVGRNGSGKSNFLDVLHFVADSLQTSLVSAVKARGGIDAMVFGGSQLSSSFGIELAIDLADGKEATYGLEVMVRERGAFAVGLESLYVRSVGGELDGFYEVDGGMHVRSSVDNMPPAFPDRLYLVNASGFAPFRETYDFLTATGFYNLNPDAMRDLQAPDAGEVLRSDGSNAASVIARLSAGRPEVMERVNSYMAAIVPGLTKIEAITLGPRETLRFTQEDGERPSPSVFLAANMSDGTLRALGALVAVAQAAGRPALNLVGIEEPENALHPAAAGALMDALREAAVRTQILVTSHSPDLLDQVSLETDSLLAVAWLHGKTMIAPLDDAGLSAIRDHLYTPGELLRLDQLDPDATDLARQAKTHLFEHRDSKA